MKRITEWLRPTMQSKPSLACSSALMQRGDNVPDFACRSGESPAANGVTADQITIAVTVYNRRCYLKQAIASALNQTVRAHVMVVEDCGPDPTISALVKGEFGDRVEYIRNPARRGLFGNWNACVEYCRTKWLSILHDDDFLDPCYVQTMVELAEKAPGFPLYFGKVIHLNQDGSVFATQDEREVDGDWTARGLRDILYTPFLFPGHLFAIDAIRRVGGFRETSYLAGDWELWAKLMARGGGAQSGKTVAYYRIHDGVERGTNQIIRQGRMLALGLVQHKRVLRLLPEAQPFSRREALRHFPMVSRFLLRYGYALSPRLLRYHVGLLRFSCPAPLKHRLFQVGTRLGGGLFVRACSKVWNGSRQILAKGTIPN